MEAHTSIHSKSTIHLLLGGGIDSSALVPFYLPRGADIKGIHFNYGQPSFDGEHRSIVALSRYYEIPVTTINLGLSITNTNGEYHCRNATLIFAAASILPNEPGILSVGIHAGTPYYDCSLSFLKDIQRLLDGYFGGSIQIEAPFLKFTKQDIYNFCHEKKIPVEITFSCEYQSNVPCGECPSCIDRRMLHATT